MIGIRQKTLCSISSPNRRRMERDGYSAIKLSLIPNTVSSFEAFSNTLPHLNSLAEQSLPTTQKTMKSHCRFQVPEFEFRNSSYINFTKFYIQRTEHTYHDWLHLQKFREIRGDPLVHRKLVLMCAHYCCLTDILNNVP